MTRHRSLAGLTLAGLLALAGTLASAIPAAAATPPSPTPHAAPAATDVQSCPGLSYDELVAKAAEAAAITHPEWNVLTSIWATDNTAGRSDLKCMEYWAFRFANPNSTAEDREVQIDPRTGAVRFIRPYGRWAPLPADAPTPYEALDAIRERGYADTVHWFGIEVEPQGVSYNFSSGGGTSVQVSWNQGKLSPVTVYGLNDVQLPDSVVANRTAHNGWDTMYAFTCPAHHPYLWKQGFGWNVLGTIVSNGYRPGTPGADVFLDLPVLTTVDGYASGWPETPGGISFDTWDPYSWSVFALCTNDPAEAYTPSTASR